jgi:hypothetical protein
MSERLACARAELAVEWLQCFDPGDGHGIVGDQAVDPAAMFTQPVVIAAFVAGAESADGLAAAARCGIEPFPIPARIEENGDLVPVDPRFGDDPMLNHTGIGLSNVRPVTGPLAGPGVADCLMAAIEGEPDAAALSMATAATFKLQTGDPRFDPAQPVLVNGFLYHPAKEA